MYVYCTSDSQPEVCRYTKRSSGVKTNLPGDGHTGDGSKTNLLGDFFI